MHPLLLIGTLCALLAAAPMSAAENADPAIAATLRLIDSFPGGSWQDVRRAVRLDSCPDTTKVGG